MLKLISAVVVALLAGAPLAGAIGDDTKTSEQGTDKAQPERAAAATTESGEVILPPGFKKKKRGDLILYCIKGKATGTRFQTESCYDEPRLKDYIRQREASIRDFEQNRAICSNPATCASP